MQISLQNGIRRTSNIYRNGSISHDSVPVWKDSVLRQGLQGREVVIKKRSPASRDAELPL